MQVAVVADLEVAGDLLAAYEVATALGACPQGEVYEQGRHHLEAARVRLATAWPAGEQDPLVAHLVGEALKGVAATGVEARVSAAVNLLGMPGRGEAALHVVDQVTAKLDSREDLGDSQAEWRLLLAFQAGRVRHHSAARQLLAPSAAHPTTFRPPR